VQWIAYLAVLLYFRADYARFIRGALSGTRTHEGKLGWMIVAGTVPIAVLGVLFKKHIEQDWRSLYVIAGAMIGLAVLLAWGEWMEHRRQARRETLRTLEQLNWTDAIVVGCFQTLALVPGASRSGSTITGGLFLGMTRDMAARFSFLLSLPAVFGAGLLEVRKLHLSTHAELANLLAAGLAAFVVGYLAIALLLGYLRKHTMWVFIIYRFALGALLLALLSRGILPP